MDVQEMDDITADISCVILWQMRILKIIFTSHPQGEYLFYNQLAN